MLTFTKVFDVLKNSINIIKYIKQLYQLHVVKTNTILIYYNIVLIIY